VLVAVDVATVRNGAVVALVVVVVGAVLVARLVQKLVVRAVVVAVLALLALSIWVQRSELSDCREQGSCRFFGQDVEVPTTSPR
jgi:hypothetical protein